VRVLPVILYTLGILVGGSLPGGPGKTGVSDKVLHTIVFGGLVPVAFNAALYYRGRSAWARSLGLAVLYSVGLGGLLELWQGLLSYRSRELLDWVADAVGATIGALCVAVYMSILRGRERSES
jgi:VanZ family protein